MNTQMNDDNPEANTMMAMMTLRQEQVQLTQQRILNAFEAELLEKGYAEASIRAVAKRAGISAPTVYRYYPNKEALIVALIDAAEAEQGFDPFTVLASTQDPMEAITKLLDGSWDINERRPGRAKAVLQAVLVAGEDSAPSQEVLKRLAFLSREALAPLSYLPQSDLRKLEAIVALMLSRQTWHRLRFGHGLPKDVARAVVLDTVRGRLAEAQAQVPSNGKKPRQDLDRTTSAIEQRFQSATKNL